jgi:hypothetical protein
MPYCTLFINYILPYLCMLHEYHVIYSVRYYSWFHVTMVGLRAPVDTGARLYIKLLCLKWLDNRTGNSISTQCY